MPQETVPAVAMVALLRSLVRKAVDKEGLRPFAARVGVSHPTIDGIKNGTNALTKRTTVDRLAEVFDLTQTLWAAAAQFQREHPDLVAEETASGERTVREDDAPLFGNLPGWHEAERVARARAPHIPERAWVGVRAMGGMDVPTISAEAVQRFAEAWLSAEGTRPQSIDDARREAAEDEAFDPKLLRK